MDVAINSHWGIKHNRVNRMNINSFEADKQIFWNLLMVFESKYYK